jgi:predicted component of type VI protein secretion system
MKVSLVVASGAHQGKVIPIAGPQFLIGRDPGCHLRPASQAISKKHCGVVVRDGVVYVQDYGSTNGTTVNDDLVRDGEVPVADGASLKIGPLDFTVRVEAAAPAPDATPLPAASPEAAAALAAVKAVTRATAPPRDTTPSPGRPAEAPPARPAATPAPAAPARSEEDEIAAMLLGMDEDGAGPVPDGSTVMDIAAPNLSGDPAAAAAGAGDKPGDKGKKPVTTREDMTNAANDILNRMRRRPK